MQLAPGHQSLAPGYLLSCAKLSILLLLLYTYSMLDGSSILVILEIETSKIKLVVKGTLHFFWK